MTKSLEAIEYILNEKGYYVDIDQGLLFSPRNRSIGTINNVGYISAGIPHPDGTYINVNLHKILAYFMWGYDAFGTVKDVQVRHLDGNRLNNTKENLALGNASDNMFDIPKEKRIEKSYMNWQNLTEEQRAIRVENIRIGCNSPEKRLKLSLLQKIRWNKKRKSVGKILPLVCPSCGSIFYLKNADYRKKIKRSENSPAFCSQSCSGFYFWVKKPCWEYGSTLYRKEV